MGRPSKPDNNTWGASLVDVSRVILGAQLGVDHRNITANHDDRSDNLLDRSEASSLTRTPSSIAEMALLSIKQGRPKYIVVSLLCLEENAPVETVRCNTKFINCKRQEKYSNEDCS